jgi:hypothetical protein
MRSILLLCLVFTCCKKNSKPVSLATDLGIIKKSLSVPRFADYSVDTLTGRTAPVDNTDPVVKRHEFVFLSPNNNSKLAFAGHFAVIRWQHASNSIGGLIVDLTDGKAYELPKCTTGYKYTKTSRLLIVNPNSTKETCYTCATEYWVWDDTKKEFTRIELKL